MSCVKFHSGKKSVEVRGSEYLFAWNLAEEFYATIRELNEVQEEKQDDEKMLNTIIAIGSCPLSFLALFAGLVDPFL